MDQNVTDMHIWLTRILIPYVTSEYKYLFLGSDIKNKKVCVCVCVVFFNYMEQSASKNLPKKFFGPLRYPKIHFCIYKSSPLVHVPIQVKPFHTYPVS
jgi:hypothetical protein